MAGILDYYFNPQTYNGTSGLLGLPMVPMTLPDGGFQSQDMSARSVQSPSVQASPDQPAQPGLLGQIGNGIANNSNMLLALGAGLLSGEGLGGGFKNAMVGSKLDRENLNRVAATQSLIKSGISPDIAPIVAQNPTLLASAFKQKITGPSYGVNPIYATDANGRNVLVQTSNTGKAIQTQLPEGLTLSTGVDKVDLGTQWMFRDKKTGNIVGYAPKDVAGEAGAKTYGAEQGKKTAEIGAAKQRVGTALDAFERLKFSANQIKDDPSLERITGVMGVFPNWPGGGAANVQAQLDKLKSQVGLSVLQAIRDASKTGGAVGQVSNFEQQLFQNNVASVNQLQSAGKFREAMDLIIKYANDAQRRLSDAYAQDYKNIKGYQSVQQSAPSASAPNSDPLGIR